MSSDTASAQTLALIIEGERPSNELICSKLREAMLTGRSDLCKNIEADIFTYGSSTLVLAYPAPPLRNRVGESAIRLHRI